MYNDDEDKKKSLVSCHWRRVRDPRRNSEKRSRSLHRNDRLERKSIRNVIETSAGVYRPMD